MPFDKDMKITLVIYSLQSIAILLAVLFSFTFMATQQTGGDLTVVYFLIGGIIVALVIIVVVSLVFLRRDAAREAEHRRKATASLAIERIVRIPYNKDGLYLLIIVSLFCITVVVSILYQRMVVPQLYGVPSSTMENVMFLGILAFFIIILIGAIYLLYRRIRYPTTTTVMTCPRCGSGEVIEVVYSWWGGVFASVAHEVRCNKCGQAYNGATGESITKFSSRDYVIVAGIIVAVVVFIVLLKMFA